VSASEPPGNSRASGSERPRNTAASSRAAPRDGQLGITTGKTRQQIRAQCIGVDRLGAAQHPQQPALGRQHTVFHQHAHHASEQARVARLHAQLGGQGSGCERSRTRVEFPAQIAQGLNDIGGGQGIEPGHEFGVGIEAMAGRQFVHPGQHGLGHLRRRQRIFARQGHLTPHQLVQHLAHARGQAVKRRQRIGPRALEMHALELGQHPARIVQQAKVGTEGLACGQVLLVVGTHDHVVPELWPGRAVQPDALHVQQQEGVGQRGPAARQRRQ
jgi:hypothetical protein